jgi:hypothetical protein
LASSIPVPPPPAPAIAPDLEKHIVLEAPQGGAEATAGRDAAAVAQASAVLPLQQNPPASRRDKKPTVTKPRDDKPPVADTKTGGPLDERL